MKKIVLLFVVCGFIITGCTGDGPPPEMRRQVIVYISTTSLSNSSLKSTASPSENLISKIILYGVDAQNRIVETFPAISNPSVSGILLNITEPVKSFYAIANPSQTIEGAKPSTVSDLMNLTGDFSTPPVSPFLMSGKGVIINDKVNIELIRAIAKIEVIGKDGLEIKTVTVKNTPNKGFVFQQATFSLPASIDWVNYPAITSPAPSVYVAENDKKNPTRLDIIGQFEGKQASYTVTLTSDGEAIAIIRNTHYQINVKPVDNFVCNVTISIPEWVGVVVTDDHFIPDESFN